ncbi:hypothetical protein N9948_00165 [bacterium]|nr:hypothetical protein [bacterium]
MENKPYLLTFLTAIVIGLLFAYYIFMITVLGIQQQRTFQIILEKCKTDTCVLKVLVPEESKENK